LQPLKKDSTLKALKPFNIAFVGLSSGEHEFLFELDDDFFACFEGSEITSAKLNGRLVMHKMANMLDLELFITGSVLVECDRCLEPFWYQMDEQREIFVKFGPTKEEQSDEIIVIPYTDSHLDVSQYFFEFAILSLPARKIHQDDPHGKSTCNPEILSQLEKYMTKGSNTSDTASQDNKPDSRWDALKNIKFN
jgi:uncharacterized protein